MRVTDPEQVRAVLTSAEFEVPPVPPADRPGDLRHDPPVRVTRRRAAVDVQLGDAYLPAGTVLELDLAAANRDPAVRADPDRQLGFGAGPHACPGEPYALAIAAGMLEVVRGLRVTGEISYEPSPTLRIPAELWLRACPDDPSRCTDS